MKKLHLIRHAKSCWQNTQLADIDRPLSERGINACQLVAQPIYDLGCNFNHTFASPAQRAKSTIELISQALPSANINWQLVEQLYTFNSSSLLSWCQSLDDSIEELVIVGHNPALTDFCNRLANSQLSNIPTCGYVQLVSQQSCLWQDIDKTNFTLNYFLKPKQFKR